MPYKDKEVRKQKNKEYQQKYYSDNKQYYVDKARDRQLYIKEFIERVKRLSQCKCGESRHWVLDFHHQEDKDFNVSDAVKRGYSIAKVKDEIRKCMILCANCHRDLHYKEDSAS